MIETERIKMKATLLSLLVVSLYIFGTSFTSDTDISNPATIEIKGPCDCEKGWNFVVHQITPKGCREKSIYCTEGVELEPGYSCGTCPKPCSTCEEDEEGKITICRVYRSQRATSFKAECGDLQDYFKENGDFVNNGDHCGPCTCADTGDIDSDGDGICDKKDGCPEDPNRSESGPCGCDDQDTDGDGICDKDEVDDPIEEEEPKICDVSGNNTYEWIESVVINGVVNTTGSNNNGYGSYTDDAVRIGSGDVLSVWINPEHADAVCELSYAIFADWNQDGDFDDGGEMILNERSIGENGIDYQLPSDLSEGNYVMRVIVDLGRIYSACGGCIDGEAEDYLIQVQGSSCPFSYEGFDYDSDVMIRGSDGGKNWSSSWQVDTEGQAEAVVLNGSINNSNLENNGNKLGILNFPGSYLTLTRELDSPIFQKNGESWISFVYQRDFNTVFSPEINGKSTGLYVNRAGYLIIGGLKTIQLSANEPYTFLLQTRLNSGTDELTIIINPLEDGSSLYSQTYNTDIVGTVRSIGFEFWSAGTNVLNTSQYLDEISIGCTRDEVLSFSNNSNDLGNTAVETSMRIAPNPMQEGQSILITLNGSSVMMTDFVIYDTSGRMMKSGIISAGENELNLQGLLSGVYFIEIKTNEGAVREKLVIQNG